MKTLKLTITALSIVLTSCKDTKKEMVQEKIDLYGTYVDSVSNLTANEAYKNWDAIEIDYKKNKAEATEAVLNIKENAELQASLDESTIKYETFKAETIAENEHMQKAELKKALRQSLLGIGFSENDMKFMWINKDNILNVYETFVYTVENNKDTYSREDWDEIKLLYEAIDTRKNTIENEGLTSSDNREIAALKLKFAPMYTLNRMGAKSDENAAAKR